MRCANQCIERPPYTGTGIRHEFLRLATFSGAIKSFPKVQRAFWSASFDFCIRSRCLSNVVSAFLNPFGSCSILSEKILWSFKKTESNCSFTGHSPSSHEDNLFPAVEHGHDIYCHVLAPASTCSKGLFTYYVSQKQGFLHPPSPLRQQWSAFG